MANIHDKKRNQYMLKGSFRETGYDWWWHSFTGYHEKTGEARGFVFEFFTCNPALGGKDPIFGQDGKGKKPSYLMVKAMAWGEDSAQLHRFFGWDDVKISPKAPFTVEAGDCYLDETHSHGHVAVTDAEQHPEWMCGNGSLSWDLTIDKQIAFHVGYGTSALFRALGAFEMYWHAEGMKTAYSGKVIYNGETYLVRPEDCYGYADKNWGRDFTSPWIWLSSCNLTSMLTGKRLVDGAFDIGGGRPKAFGIAFERKLLSSLFCYGKNYEFNFSKFWTFPRTRFSCRETAEEIIWHVEQWTRRYKMVTDVTCQKKDMILVNYEAPNGKKLHNRLWNGGNGRGTIKLYKRFRKYDDLIDEIRAENVGCEFGEYDRED